MSLLPTLDVQQSADTPMQVSGSSTESTPDEGVLAMSTLPLSGTIAVVTGALLMAEFIQRHRAIQGDWDGS